VLNFVKQQLPAEVDAFAEALGRDYRKDGRTDKPSFLSGFEPTDGPAELTVTSAGAKRQARHRKTAVK
jgi:hypothetical protein